MVAGALFGAHRAVHAGHFQPAGQRGAEQQVIEPQTGIAFEAVADVMPERVDPLVAVGLA
jgi:hypothetical protein